MSKRRRQGSDKCRNCGAEMTAVPAPSVLGGFDVVCAYCGHRDHIDANPPAAAQPPRAPRPPRPAIPQGEPAPRPVRSTPRAPLIIILAGVAIVSVALFFVSRKTAAITSSNAWDSAPIVAAIAGNEAIVGRLRQTGSKDALFVAAFDATTFAQRWKAGPFGSYHDGNVYTNVTVAGSHVVVTDLHAKVHVLDLQTGKEQRVVSLTDKVEADLDSEMRIERSICPADAEHVWLAQIDKRTVLVDLTSGGVADAPRPKACDRGFVQTRNLAGVSDTYALGASFEWDEPHFTADSIPFEAKSMFVVLGKKTPGTPTPMVAGVDKKDRAVRWQVPLAAVDAATVRDGSAKKSRAAVCGDRFIGSYGVGDKGWHMTALDATSGARQWDVVIAPRSGSSSVGTVVCSPARVYVVRKRGVDVLDASTGKALGTVTP